MSILRSNKAGFQITRQFLLSRGYIERTPAGACMYRKDSSFKNKKHKHYLILWTAPDDSELFIVELQDTHYEYSIPIETLDALQLLERYWDEKNQQKKINIKRKLIKLNSIMKREVGPRVWIE